MRNKATAEGNLVHPDLAYVRLIFCVPLAPPVQTTRVSHGQTQCSQLNQSWRKRSKQFIMAVKTGVVRLRVGDFVLASQIQGLFSLRLENAKRKSLDMLRLTLREFRTTQLLRCLNSPHVEITSSFALAEPVAHQPTPTYAKTG